ncbi:LOW QUALITY PROTEIN: hypothetical protein V1477_017781 [Vespula maculifrons]|uniref:Uncharacterized protein n=1 Tax=Vespula maculifrons TaxID=7453 RepID=A0ABD2B0H1_VESMC
MSVTRRSHSNDPGPVFVGATLSEKKIVKEKFFFHLFLSNRYNSAPIGQILIKGIWTCRTRRALSNDPGPVFLGATLSEKKIVKILIRKICACRPRRSLSSDAGPVSIGATLSEKKIVKEKFFFHLPDPDKKIWACRARRALSSDPSPAFVGATVSEKKIVTEKFFFPMFPLNSYNWVPIGQILIKKIWACRARRALSSDPGSASVGAIVSEKKNVTEKYFFSLFPLNRYNSVPIDLDKRIWAHRARRVLSNDPGPVFLCATLSENKIVKEKFFFPLFPLNRYNSAPIGQILIRKICACRPRRSLSNDPGPVFLDLDKKIWACRTRRALSNDSGPAFLGAILSEKKIVKEKFFFPLFLLNHYNSASIGQILIKKYGRDAKCPFQCPGRVFLGAIVSEKKIVKEKKILSKKFFFPLFPLNRYNSVPIGQILIKNIWACRARRALSSDPGSAFVGAIFSEKKIVTEKYFFPLFHLNRYNSVPIDQILIKKIWACRKRSALSNDPGPV